MSAAESFRKRVRRGERLLGTFLKAPGVHATEILAGVGFDLLVIDQEHGPFDSTALDTMALAAWASGTACLVRVADASRAGSCGALTMTDHVEAADRTVTGAAPFAEQGAIGFIIGFDQAFMRTATADVQARFRAEMVGESG